MREVIRTTEVIKIGNNTYRKVDTQRKKRTSYKRESRYGGIFKNARQQANLREDKLRALKLKRKLQQEQKEYSAERKKISAEKRAERKAKLKALHAKASGSISTAKGFFNKKKKIQEKQAEHQSAINKVNQSKPYGGFESARRE